MLFYQPNTEYKALLIRSNYNFKVFYLIYSPMKKTPLQKNGNPFWWTVVALLILMFFAKTNLQASKIGQLDYSQVAILFLCGQFFSSLLFNAKKEWNLTLNKILIQAHIWISIMTTCLFLGCCTYILLSNAQSNDNIMMGILVIGSASMLILIHLMTYSSLLFKRLLNTK